MISIVAEGWRFIPHSYAIVNQWQCLELLKRPGLELFFRGVPPYSARWTEVRGLMSSDQEAALARLGDVPRGGRVDGVIRISVPVRFGRAEARRLLVMGTADFAWLPRAMIENRQSLAEAHRASEAIIFAPSAWSQMGLLRAGADPERVVVVPHGVDPVVFGPATAAERTKLKAAAGWSDKFVFLNVSAMTLSKGTDLLLKAFSRVAMRHPDTLLILKGSNQVYRSQNLLQRWVRERLTADERTAIKGRIRYIGSSLPFSALAAIYRTADAYVTPYRSESFNLPAIEAVASGLPLICTAGGPTDEFTTTDFALRISAALGPGSRDNELIRQPHLDELVQALFYVIENTTFREAALKLGPAYVSARFTWRHTVDRLLEIVAA